MSIQKAKIRLVALTAFAVVAVGAPAAYAATTYNSQLTQQITNGVLSTDIRNASNVVVTTPTFAMSTVPVSVTQQTSTGTFGDNTQRVYVENPGATATGWTLTLNAATPGTGTWTSGANSYPYNGTAATGQLTVNPAAGTITPTTGSATGVTKGTSASFTGTNPITLMSASSSAAPIWNGYITGVGLSQTIPAAQPAGNYTINLVQTVASV